MNDRAPVSSIDYQDLIDTIGARAKQAATVMTKAATASKNKASSLGLNDERSRPCLEH